MARLKFNSQQLPLLALLLDLVLRTVSARSSSNLADLMLLDSSASHTSDRRAPRHVYMSVEIEPPPPGYQKQHSEFLPNNIIDDEPAKEANFVRRREDIDYANRLNKIQQQLSSPRKAQHQPEQTTRPDNRDTATEFRGRVGAPRQKQSSSAQRTHQHVHVQQAHLRRNHSGDRSALSAHRSERSPQIVLQSSARFDHDEFYEELFQNQFRVTYFDPARDASEKPCGMLINAGRKAFHDRYTSRFRRCKLTCYEPKWVAISCAGLQNAHELVDNLNILKEFVHEMNRLPFGIAGLNLSLSIEASKIYQLPATLLQDTLHKYAQFVRQIHFVNCTSLTSPLLDLSSATQLDLLSIRGCPNVRALHRARLPSGHKLNLVRLRLLLHDTGLKTLTELELPPHLEALEFVCTRKCRIGRVQPELFSNFPLLDYVYIDGVADGLQAANVLNGTSRVSVVVIRNSRLNTNGDSSSEGEEGTGGGSWSVGSRNGAGEQLYDENDALSRRGLPIVRGGPRMRALILENVGLETLPARAFHGGEKRLQYLSLANNQLERIDRETFQHLPALRYLNFNNNPIRAIERDTFNRLSHMRELRLPSHGESFYDCRDCTNLWLRDWLKSSPAYLHPRDPSYYYCFAESNGVKEYRPVIEKDDDKCDFTSTAAQSTRGERVKVYGNVEDEDQQASEKERFQQREKQHQRPNFDMESLDDNGQRDAGHAQTNYDRQAAPTGETRRDTSRIYLRNNSMHENDEARAQQEMMHRQQLQQHRQQVQQQQQQQHHQHQRPQLVAAASAVPNTRNRNPGVEGREDDGENANSRARPTGYFSTNMLSPSSAAAAEASRQKEATSGGGVYVPQPVASQPVYGVRNASAAAATAEKQRQQQKQREMSKQQKQKQQQSPTPQGDPSSAVTLSTSTKSAKSGASLMLPRVTVTVLLLLPFLSSSFCCSLGGNNFSYVREIFDCLLKLERDFLTAAWMAIQKAKIKQKFINLLQHSNFSLRSRKRPSAAILPTTINLWQTSRCARHWKMSNDAEKI